MAIGLFGGMTIPSGVAANISAGLDATGGQGSSPSGEGTAAIAGESRLAEVYKTACLSVVTVTGSHAMESDATTGFVVGEGGLVATVFSGDTTPQQVTVRSGDRIFPGKLVAIDDKTRLALLKVDGLTAPPLDLVPSRNVQLGQFVHAVTEMSDPLHRALEGRLAGKERHFRRTLLPVTLFRIHLESRPPGVFGAPALDDEGKVVGVLLLSIPDEDRSVYALPAEIAIKLCRDYLDRGSVSHGWLGLTLEDGTTTPRILECYENGPAYQAGLRSGDVILRIGDLAVAEYHDVVEATYFLVPGEATEVEVLRDLERKVFKLTPIEKKEGSVPAPKPGEAPKGAASGAQE